MTDTEKYFNPASLKDIIELEETGDDGLLLALVSDFDSNCANLLRELEGAAAQKDYETIERAAHTIKSSSKLLGFEANSRQFFPDKLKQLERSLEMGRKEIHQFCKDRAFSKARG